MQKTPKVIPKGPPSVPKVTQSGAKVSQSPPARVNGSGGGVILDFLKTKIRRQNDYNLFMDPFGSDLGAKLGQLRPNLAPTSANLGQTELKVKPK